MCVPRKAYQEEEVKPHFQGPDLNDLQEIDDDLTQLIDELEWLSSVTDDTAVTPIDNDLPSDWALNDELEEPNPNEMEQDSTATNNFMPQDNEDMSIDDKPEESKTDELAEANNNETKENDTDENKE